MKKKVALILAVVIFFMNMFVIPTEVCLATSQDIDDALTVDDILQNYFNEVNFKTSMTENMVAKSDSAKAESVVEIQNETVDQLKVLGHLAYSVTTDTYDSIQNELETDLSQLGLERGRNYIIIVGNGSNSTAATRATESGWYYYPYEGVMYKMRTLTITAADDPYMAKADYADLINTKERQLIIDCLDTLISVGLDAMCAGLGTVASICGLSIDMILPDQNCTMLFHAATNRTEIHTQVWSEAYNQWRTGAYVEQAYCSYYISGHYYSADSNTMEAFPQDISSKTLYSEYYFNSNWTNNMAAQYFDSTYQIADTVGSVPYTYGDTELFVH